MSSVSSGESPKLARVVEQLRRLKGLIENPPLKENQLSEEQDFVNSQRFKRLKVAHDLQKNSNLKGVQHHERADPVQKSANKFVLPPHVSWICKVSF